MTESEIAAALKQGDQAALEALYDQYAPALFGLILRIVQSEQTAGEVLQETFLKIWRNTGNFDESKEKLLSWLLDLARNTAIETTRNNDFKSQTGNANFDFLSYQEMHPAPAAGPVTLRTIGNQINEKLVRVADLAYFQGLSQSEIEQEVNIPVGTVKTRLRMVQRELRKIFSETSA